MTATLSENITCEAVIVILEVARTFLYNCKDLFGIDKCRLIKSHAVSFMLCCLLSSCRVIALTCSFSCAFIRALWRQSRSWRYAVVLLHAALSAWKTSKENQAAFDYCTLFCCTWICLYVSWELGIAVAGMSDRSLEFQTSDLTLYWVDSAHGRRLVLCLSVIITAHTKQSVL